MDSPDSSTYPLQHYINAMQRHGLHKRLNRQTSTNDPHPLHHPLSQACALPAGSDGKVAGRPIPNLFSRNARASRNGAGATAG